MDLNSEAIVAIEGKNLQYYVDGKFSHEGRPFFQKVKDFLTPEEQKLLHSLPLQFSTEEAAEVIYPYEFAAGDKAVYVAGDSTKWAATVAALRSLYGEDVEISKAPLRWNVLSNTRKKLYKLVELGYVTIIEPGVWKNEL